MSIEENTELVKKVLASGLDVLEFLAEDAVWVIPGFGTYRGKQDIYTKLLAPTHALMECMGRSVITNIVADGDYVVAESYAKDRMTKSERRITTPTVTYTRWWMASSTTLPSMPTPLWQKTFLLAETRERVRLSRRHRIKAATPGMLSLVVWERDPPTVYARACTLTGIRV